MEEGKRQKRPRRSFTDEFKAGTVRLVLDEGKSVSQVAHDPLSLLHSGKSTVAIGRITLSSGRRCAGMQAIARGSP